jgi:hypothetical protein
VPTAAGIDITVAPSFAPAIRGFIADAVAAGYKPSRIKCFSLSRSHVRNSPNRQFGRHLLIVEIRATASALEGIRTDLQAFCQCYRRQLLAQRTWDNFEKEEE